MTILLTVFHVLVCVFLILVVLTQQGKGQDLASAFGGAGTQAAFGARGTATLLTRVTAGAAAIFMITSLLLGYISSESGEQSVVGPGGAPTAPAPDPAGETPTDAEAEDGAAAPEGEAAPDAPGAGEEPAGEEPEPPEPEPR